MQHSLTMDKHFVQPGLTMDKSSAEHSFHLDLPLAVFVVVMALLFLVFGTMLSPGPFVPVNYEIFW